MSLTRQSWVILHRWAGLTMALFLAVAGFTGIALAWEDDLEALIAPHYLRATPPVAGTPMLDPAMLATAAERRHPGMAVTYLPLHVAAGRTLRLNVAWPGATPATAPDWDELFIDPYTGAERGHRRWGDIGQGVHNLMPLIYRLHYTLLLGTAGTLAMGIAALVWTVDCFVGFYLTLPLRARPPRNGHRTVIAKRPGWWHRWKPAWMVRWRASSYKLTFDLHRAGGLWIWPLLLVFGWSSVSFNLPAVYNPVMQRLGANDPEAALAALTLPAPRAHPRLGYAAARDRGAALARAVARQAGQHIDPQGLSWLYPLPAQGVYLYGFTTGGDIPDAGGASRLLLDSDSGALRGTDLAGARPAANRVTDWLVALHMAAVWRLPWRLVTSAVGALVTMLSVTGVVIWTRKRSGRIGRRQRAVPAP